MAHCCHRDLSRRPHDCLLPRMLGLVPAWLPIACITAHVRSRRSCEVAVMIYRRLHDRKSLPRHEAEGLANPYISSHTPWGAWGWRHRRHWQNHGIVILVKVTDADATSFHMSVEHPLRMTGCCLRTFPVQPVGSADMMAWLRERLDQGRQPAINHR